MASHIITARAPDVVRWTAVIAGVVIGLGVFALLNSFWWAIEYSAGNSWVSNQGHVMITDCDEL